MFILIMSRSFRHCRNEQLIEPVNDTSRFNDDAVVVRTFIWSGLISWAFVIMKNNDRRRVIK